MEPWQPAPALIEGSRNKMIEKINEELEENEIRVTIAASEGL